MRIKKLIKKTFAWTIISLGLIGLILLSSTLILSSPSDEVKRGIYFYHTRPFIKILNDTKVFIESRFKEFNQMFGGIPKTNITHSMNLLNDDRTFKIAKYTGEKCYAGYDYTIVLWCQKTKSEQFKRALEASFCKKNNTVRVRIIVDNMLSTSEEQTMTLKKYSSLAEFDLNNHFAKIYVSHCSPNNKYIPPYLAMNAYLKEDIVTLNSISYWPDNINEVGYVDVGTKVNGININAMTGNLLKINCNANLNNDLIFATGNIITFGKNDNSKNINDSLTSYNFPIGNGKGTYLGKLWIDGKDINEKKLPRLITEPDPDYKINCEKTPSLCNLDNSTMTGEEVYNICRKISLYNPANYPFDNSDGLADNPDF